MYSDYGRNDYDRNDRVNDRYSRDSYSSGYGQEFTDRDAYDYRARMEDYPDNNERDGYPVDRRPDRRENSYERRDLNHDFRINDKIKSLFNKRERQDVSPRQEQQEQAPTNNAKNLVIYSPKTYRDVKKLIDFLRNNEPIIVDLAEIKHEKGQRILDFLSGALYALNGNMHKISGSIYLFTPYGVNIMVPTELFEKLDKDE